MRDVLLLMETDKCRDMKGKGLLPTKLSLDFDIQIHYTEDGDEGESLLSHNTKYEFEEIYCLKNKVKTGPKSKKPTKFSPNELEKNIIFHMGLPGRVAYPCSFLSFSPGSREY